MRSKTLLVSNILASIYAISLLWIYGGAIVSAGGMDFIHYLKQYLNMAFTIAGFDSVPLNILIVIGVLLVIHICVFTVAALIGWIGYLTKKSGLAKFAAALYLIGVICFPVYIIFGLPIMIIGFVAGGCQKKINTAAIAA